MCFFRCPHESTVRPRSQSCFLQYIFGEGDTSFLLRERHNSTQWGAWRVEVDRYHQIMLKQIVIRFHFISLTVAGHSVDLFAVRGFVLVFRVALPNTSLVVCVLCSSSLGGWIKVIIFPHCVTLAYMIKLLVRVLIW